jgi:hypothetical protein
VVGRFRDLCEKVGAGRRNSSENLEDERNVRRNLDLDERVWKDEDYRIFSGFFE